MSTSSSIISSAPITVVPATTVASNSNPAISISTAPSTLETILADVFELGLGAIGIFVKNPNHQQTAVNVANVLKTIFPFL